MNTPDEWGASSLRLFKILPKDQWDAMMKTDAWAEIEPEFLGFIWTYELLAKLIPLEWTVIDLGCAYNAQCFLFTDHKQYIAVDNYPNSPKFKSPNCTIYEKSIESFIKDDIGQFELNKTFAICNYVPPWGGDNGKMVREAFPNLYVFYPH